ncbi:unnamed protein product [Echinostoma caproni]|uniref:HA2 domain-containing protein n=1 Tax=Echinostoma caproni TaxID=27848 RepID=A0A183A5F9_9TREM|nr:unnamed protein product [Echinostoma caproni]
MLAYLSKFPGLQETVVAVVAGILAQPKNGLSSRVLPEEKIRVNEKHYLGDKEALVLLHANAFSSRNKWAELATVAAGMMAHLIVLSETWLTQDDLIPKPV